MKYRGIDKLPIQDNQFGISVSCGAELPAFITREYYRKKTLFQTISLDITNAFNSVNREAMLNKVKNSIPELAPLVGLLYLHDSRLTLSSGEVIYSKQGVRQGCPLSPMLFSLVIDDVLQAENEIAKEYGAQVVAYLDDHTFIQTKEAKDKKTELQLDVISARIQPLLDKLDLKLNQKKCYIYRPNYNEAEAEGEGDEKDRNIDTETETETESDIEIEIDLEEMEKEDDKDPVDERQKPPPDKPSKQDDQATFSHDGVVLLGIPIGTKDFIKDFVNQTLKEKINACKRLTVPTQIAYHMLRLVIAPTPGFLVRALGDNLDPFKEWDRGIEREVFRLANQPHDYLEYKGKEEEERITEEDRMKLLENYEREVKVKKRTSHTKENFQIAESLIFLSSREGGLGIMQVERMAMNAFLASSINSMAILGSRKIKFALSEETKSLVKDSIRKLKKINYSLAHKIEKDEYDKISPIETWKLQGELTKVTQGDLKSQIKKSFKEQSMKRLKPLFEDHQGDHANRVLIKPPTFTKTYQIEDGVMQEIISQTLLLPNDLGIKKCVAEKSNSEDNHQCVAANHMNACAYTGGVAIRHTQAKHTLEKALKVAGIPHTNERQMAKEGTNFRADIFIPDEPTVIDVTCVQTSQNNKTLEKAMEKAYGDKIKDYNRMKYKCKLRGEFKKGVKLIPVVIGPRGQFYEKSWKDVTRLFGIQSSKASRQEALGVDPLLKNDLDPEKASLVISLLKGLAFRAAVSTAQNARKWQELQREHWNHNEVASRVTIERPNH